MFLFFHVAFKFFSVFGFQYISQVTPLFQVLYKIWKCYIKYICVLLALLRGSWVCDLKAFINLRIFLDIIPLSHFSFWVSSYTYVRTIQIAPQLLDILFFVTFISFSVLTCRISFQLTVIFLSYLQEQLETPNTLKENYLLESLPPSSRRGISFLCFP